MERGTIVTCAWFPNYVWQRGNLQRALKKKKKLKVFGPYRKCVFKN